MKPFEQLVSDHGRTVFRVCAAVVGPSDAEDAWSETFLAALQAYPSLDAATNLEAWLVTIARRKAIDLYRRRQRQQAATEGLVPVLVHGHDDEVSDRTTLSRAVSALPCKQQRAVAWHYVAGLSYAEVAELLGGSVDAARRAAADGVKTLRRTFEVERTAS